MATTGESGQTAESMGDEASIEKYLAGKRMPESHDPWPGALLRFNGDQAERVIGKVHGHVKTDDDAADGAESRESWGRDQRKQSDR